MGGSVKPSRLQPGDTIGIASPAGPFQKDLLETGISKWEKFGFRVKRGSSLYEKERYFAGNGASRADELNELIRDPDVRGIVCARGGYGTMRIVDAIDWEALRSDPKPLIGFSDATFLLQAWLTESGGGAIHGPMAANLSFLSYKDDDDRFLLDLLTNPNARPNIAGGDIAVHREGAALGPLVGGCLSLVHLTIGTPWEIDTAGRILFLEDQNEPAYRIDRMLTHLKIAGKLDEVAAVVFGNLGLPFDEIAPAVDELIPGVPVLHGLPCGHGKRNLPLPLGVQVEVDSAAPGIRFLEGAVA